MPNVEDQYPITPGCWIRTEKGEKLFFRRYSWTRHWGFFGDDSHHTTAEHKLPLAGLEPWDRS